MSCSRTAFIATLALGFLRIVIGLHFFLEGSSHLRDPSWSSAGFRKAAIGPLAPLLKADLPETGDWRETLGASHDADPTAVATAAAAWRASVVSGWEQLGQRREKILRASGWTPGADEAATTAAALAAADTKLAQMLDEVADDLVDYRRQAGRLAEMEMSAMATDLPYMQERIAEKRRELGSLAAGWMAEADAVGEELVASWNEPLTLEQRRLATAAVQPTRLWKADRFVSWALVTIGAGLVLGLLTKFHAMGGVFFLLSVAASQPFWLPAAQATYDQWVEIAGLLVVASVPVGGWSGLDYFLAPLLSKYCPLRSCCRRGA
jgi:uncharacterized membrane protein YphA (DoxX/SURF4 family)